MDDVSRFFGGCVVLFFCCTLAAAGGIGGGGLNVPILLAVFGYDYDTAVILSLFVVMGNVSSQVYINWNKRHPKNKSRPLIYWDVILLMGPAQLGGSSLGVIIAKILPASIMEIIAIMVLVFAIFMTFRKSQKLWNLESAAKNMLYEPLTTKDDDYLITSDDSQVQSDDLKDDGVAELQTDGLGAEAKESSEANSLLVKNSVLVKINFPYHHLYALLGTWLFYASLSTAMSQVVKCSDEWYGIYAASFPVLGWICWYGMRQVYALHKAADEPALEGDIDTSRKSFGPAINAFVIGIFCALLGIGGGELMGPYLLAHHVLPQISSATTSFMSLSSSSSSVLHHFVLGDVPVKEAATLWVVGLLGGAAGRVGALKVTRMCGRPSILTFTLTLILTISVCIMLVEIATHKFEVKLENACT